MSAACTASTLLPCLCLVRARWRAGPRGGTFRLRSAEPALDHPVYGGAGVGYRGQSEPVSFAGGVACATPKRAAHRGRVKQLP
jgi:hypothetical protein